MATCPTASTRYSSFTGTPSTRNRFSGLAVLTLALLLSSSVLLAEEKPLRLLPGEGWAAEAPSFPPDLLQDYIDRHGIGVDAYELERFAEGLSEGVLSPDKTNAGDFLFGPEARFRSGTAFYISVVALDVAHFVIAFQESIPFGTRFGAAIAGRVDAAGNITYGPQRTFKADSTTFISGARIDGTRFAVVYNDETAPRSSEAVIGQVNLTTLDIAFGTPVVFYAGNPAFADVATLNASQIVVGFGNSSLPNGTRIGTVTGTSVSFGPTTPFTGLVGMFGLSVTTLDSTRFVAAYNDFGAGSERIAAVVGTVSGTSISHGAEAVLYTGAGSFGPQVEALSASKFITAWQLGFNGPVVASAGTATGSVLTPGTTANLSDGFGVSLNNFRLAALDATHFATTYQSVGIAGTNLSKVGHVPTTTIEFGAPFVSFAANTLGMTALTSTRIIAGYNARPTFFDEGLARVGDIVPPLPDLEVFASNDGSPVGGGASWEWRLNARNTGSADATFTSGQVLLSTQLPNTNVSYGAVTVDSLTGVTGSIACSINAAQLLTCSASGGSVTLAGFSSFRARFTATPSATGTFTLPTGGTCGMDPNGVIAERDETDNSCIANSVLVQAPNLTLTKSSSGSSVPAGTPWEWRLVAANDGNLAATFTNGQTILSDQLPSSGVSYGAVTVDNQTGITGTVSCSINASSLLTCTASGGDVTFAATSSSFRARVTATPSLVGTFTNPTGGACAIDPSGLIVEGDEGDNACAPNSVLVLSPDLSLAKSSDVSLVALGGSWEWRLDVANGGNSAATFSTGQRLLTDQLPTTSVSYGAVTVINPTGITGTIACAINASGRLDCNASGTVTVAAAGSFRVRFNATPSAIGSYTNPTGGTCAVDPDALIPESAEGNNACAANTVTVQSPELTVTKSNDGSTVALGGSWEWRLDVANGGNSAATFSTGQRLLTDQLPTTGVSYGAVSVINPTGITGTIACAINASGRLDCNASGTVTVATAGSFRVRFNATPSAIGSYTNPTGGTCAVDPDALIPESAEGNNACAANTVTVQSPELTVTKSNDGSTVALGGSWEWRLDVANGGNSAATFSTGQRLLTDQLPTTSVSYGAVSVINPTGITGTIACAINASGRLDCNASGTVTVAAAGSFRVRFNATPSAIGSYTNPTGGTCAVDPDALIPESAEGNNACAANTVTVQSPELTVTKSNDGSTVALGGSWEWRLDVANGGNSAATFSTGQRLLTDQLPTTGVSYGAVSVINPTGITGTIACAINASGRLDCNASGTVTVAAAGSFRVRFNATPSAIGSYTNPTGGTCAVDPDALIPESAEGNNACAANTVTVQSPELTATKSNDGSTVALGGSWEWRLDVANGGNSTATFSTGQRLLTDQLPTTSVSYGAVTVINPTGITGTIACAINASGRLDCNASGTVTVAAAGSFRVRFNATPSAIGSYTNPTGGTCAVDPDALIPESAEGNNACSANTVTVQAPELAVTKSNDGSTVALGDTWEWRLDVANGGNSTATFSTGQRLLTDQLPTTGVTYGAATVINTTGITGTIACAINASGRLDCNASGTVTVAVAGSFRVRFNATPSVIGSYTNPTGGACAVDPDALIPESAEGNNACSANTVTVQAPELTVTKSNDGSPVALGDTWEWRLDVANGGNSTATFSTGQRLLTDQLPTTGVTYGAVTVINTTGITGTIACTINASGRLDCNASGTVTVAAVGSFRVRFDATPSVIGSYTNPTGGACAVDPDALIPESVEGNNACAADTVTVQAPELTVTKSNDGTPIALGESWEWRLDVANGGTSSAMFAADDLLLSDQLPTTDVTYGSVTVDNLVGVSGTVTCGISDSGLLTCIADSGSVDLNVASSFRIRFTATPSQVGSFTNPTGGACAVDPNDLIPESDEGNNTCAADTVVVDAPNLTVDKSNDGSPVALGDSFEWQLILSNSGTSTATFADGALLLNDSLPDTGLTYGTVAVDSLSGVTGTVACSIDATSLLSCTAEGGQVLLDAPGSLRIRLTATPTQVGNYTNPTGGPCAADPEDRIPESDELDNDCPSDTVVVDAPDLEIIPSNNGTPIPLGDSWQWYLDVSNSGTSAATFATDQLLVADQLPTTNIGYGAVTVENALGVTGTIACSINDTGLLTCWADGGPVVLDAPSSFRIQWTATTTAIGTFTNPTGGPCSVDPDNVQIESDETDNACSPNGVLVEAVDLTTSTLDAIEASGDGQAQPGEVIAFSLHVINTGNIDATPVSLRAAVPIATALDVSSVEIFLEGGASDATNLSKLNQVQVEVAVIPPGSSVTVQFQLTVQPTVPAGTDTIVTSAEISSAGTPLFNTPPATLLLDAAPDLAIAIDDGGFPVRDGEEIVYRLSYFNLGTEGATDVVLTETVPLHTTYIGTRWACVPHNGADSTCTLPISGEVDGGISGSTEFRVLLDSPLSLSIDEIVNIASISDGSDQDSNLSNNEAVAVTTRFLATVEIPTLDHAGLILMALILSAAACRRIQS